ncbi:septation protein A [Pelomonas cellulosilytica]|uniref:Inner membrane-spanning protein YciB n=1 Tax=Pelomonas cellulosilytica TaxID=2906762 RepID=A0ABS8XRN8_9BURK|nr:septation protein A [Pelomonas sp. P8]MCE4553266.1 septation protein A [Pelomonas sp. P8]
MKLLLDFLPLILFFGSYQYGKNHAAWAAAFTTEHFGFMVSGGTVGTEEGPVMLATLVVMAATLAQVVILKLLRRKVDLMLWISLVLVVSLGALTVWFHNKTFIMWKPTGVYWAMALALWGSQAFLRKNLIQAMLGSELALPASVWTALNRAWIVFFSCMGVLNLLVAYNFSEATWVGFKAYGSTALLVVFTLAQGFYMGKFMPDDSGPKS